MKYLLIILLSASPTFGSFTKGNGGNVLFCHEQQNLPVLDYYEMKYFLGFEKDEGVFRNFETKIQDRMKTVFAILDSQSSAFLQKQFREVFQNFFKKTYWVKDAQLGNVEDSFVLALPKECRLVTAAIQRNGYFYLQNEIWHSLDSEQQQILQLHEVIYAMMISSSPLNDSRPVRALVGLLISKDFESLAPQQMALFFKSHQIRF